MEISIGEAKVDAKGQARKKGLPVAVLVVSVEASGEKREG